MRAAVASPTAREEARATASSMRGCESAERGGARARCGRRQKRDGGDDARTRTRETNPTATLAGFERFSISTRATRRDVGRARGEGEAKDAERD